MFGYYKIGVLYPSLVVILLQISYSFYESVGYESEWFTAGSFIFIEFVFSLLICIVIILLSLGIFANSINHYTSWIKVFVNWFGMPLVFFSYFIYQFFKAYEVQGYASFIYIVLTIFPFFVGLIYSFLKYINEVPKKN